LREQNVLDHSTSALRKHLGPEIGGLNVKQSEGILALAHVLSATLVALRSLNDELNQIFSFISTDKDGEIVVQAGEASIRLKKDGAIDIKGKDIRVTGSGEINVKASKELNLKGSRIQQN
jgi:hypothetical protein